LWKADLRESVLTKPHPSDYNFAMNGSVRQDRNSFFVDIRWQGERCRIFSDKDGTPLDSKRRADRLLSHIRYEIDHGLFDPKNYVKRELKALLFVNHVESWLGRQQLRVEAGEIAREYLRSSGAWVRNYLIPFFGKRNIRDIHEGMVEDFLLQLPPRLSKKSRANIANLLHKILRDAFRRHDIARIPDFPKIEVGEPEIKWITPEEQAQIMSHVKCPIRKAFFLFLMHQGCRPGEARALRWEDIDWRTQTVTIHAAMDQETYRPTTKEKDIRILPLHPAVITGLKDLPRALSGYVFTYRGKPLQKKLTWRTWRTAAKKAGIDIGQYQGTKHSLGNWAVNNGVPLNIIQAYMGHKSSSTTKRYAKLQVESLKVMHREARAAEGQQVENLRRK
jgi:integrase